MKLSNTCGHAIAALVYIADADPSSLLSNRNICSGANLPRPFLLRLLGTLTVEGVIMSVRGRYGGFKLSRPAEEITLLQIVEAIEGPILAFHPVDGAWLGADAMALIEAALIESASDARRRLAATTLADLRAGTPA